MVVFYLIKEFDECVEQQAEQLERKVNDRHDYGVNLKPSEREIEIFRKSKEREFVKREIQIEQIEEVYAVELRFCIAVQNRTGYEHEYEIQREANPHVKQRFLFQTREDAQAHRKCGDCQNQRVFENVVHIPKTKAARWEVGHNDSDQCAGYVRKETEMEHLFQAEGDTY